MVSLFSKKEITLEYTVDRCDSCARSRRREYKSGDVLFERPGAGGDACDCGGAFYVDMIYGESTVQ